MPWSTLLSLILPPGLFIMLGLLAWWRRNHRGGGLLAAAALLGLYLCSTPVVSYWAVSGLEQTPPLNAQNPALRDAQAIVVLGGGRNHSAPEYGGTDHVNLFTLERLRYAAHLHRHTDLPLLVSGGDPPQRGSSEASMMARTLQEDFGIQVRWMEGRSRNTQENAEFSYQLLREAGIERIILVSKALHLPRAEAAFRRAGFEHITLAPLGYTRSEPLGGSVTDWLPSHSSLSVTSLAMREYIGRLWYGLYYR